MVHTVCQWWIVEEMVDVEVTGLLGIPVPKYGNKTLCTVDLRCQDAIREGRPSWQSINMVGMWMYT
jgi:hypothetical protein